LYIERYNKAFSLSAFKEKKKNRKKKPRLSADKKCQRIILGMGLIAVCKVTHEDLSHAN